MAEQVFLARSRGLSGPGAPFQVESCGLAADPGSGSHPGCALALDRIGVPHRVRPPRIASKGLLDRADLAISMTSRQAHQMATGFPRYHRKCFSLMEINGALWTLLGEPSTGPDSLPLLERGALARGLKRAGMLVCDTPRGDLKPLEGVPLSTRELVKHFAPCFFQVSAVHDPAGGGIDEITGCALLVDRETSRLLEYLLLLAARLA